MESGFLDYDVSLDIFQKTGFMFAEPLFRGKYQDAMSYLIGFESKIPGKLGLPEIKGNKAEGIVIRPIKSITVSTKKGNCRVMVKKKIPEFAEDKRFYQSQKSEAKRETGELSGLELIGYEIEAVLTEARLVNAISKTGPVDKENKEKMKLLLAVLVEDVLNEITFNCEVEVHSLDVQEREQLEGNITLRCKKLIVAYCKAASN
eukprot:TRINITY_DN3885_c0_g1_i1.p1 TRINITY_DN3885_c0_g1~~TRINITY_DN3885_c0_g1_i1.p1  ORF type:complete len:204 (-),score=49.86 TRINITY_DN3885_c0_g1_i1:18-629(-)